MIEPIQGKNQQDSLESQYINPCTLLVNAFSQAKNQLITRLTDDEKNKFNQKNHQLTEQKEMLEAKLNELQGLNLKRQQLTSREDQLKKRENEVDEKLRNDNQNANIISSFTRIFENFNNQQQKIAELSQQRINNQQIIKLTNQITKIKDELLLKKLRCQQLETEAILRETESKELKNELEVVRNKLKNQEQQRSNFKASLSEKAVKLEQNYQRLEKSLEKLTHEKIRGEFQSTIYKLEEQVAQLNNFKRMVQTHPLEIYKLNQQITKLNHQLQSKDNELIQVNCNFIQQLGQKENLIRGRVEMEFKQRDEAKDKYIQKIEEQHSRTVQKIKADVQQRQNLFSQQTQKLKESEVMFKNLLANHDKLEKETILLKSEISRLQQKLKTKDTLLLGLSAKYEGLVQRQKQQTTGKQRIIEERDRLIQKIVSSFTNRPASVEQAQALVQQQTDKLKAEFEQKDAQLQAQRESNKQILRNIDASKKWLRRINGLMKTRTLVFLAEEIKEDLCSDSQLRVELSNWIKNCLDLQREWMKRVQQKGQQLRKIRDEREKLAKDLDVALKKLQVTSTQLGKSIVNYKEIVVLKMNAEMERNSLQKDIAKAKKDNLELTTTIQANQTAMSELTNKNTLLTSDVIDLTNKIDQYQNVTCKILQEELTKVKRQNETTKAILKQKQNKIAQLNKQIKVVEKKGEKIQSEIELKKLEMFEMQVGLQQCRKSIEQLKAQAQRNINRICQAIQDTFQQSPASSFASIVDFIRRSKTTKNTTLTVSSILEGLTEHRTFIISEAIKFLNCSKLSSTLLFRYDEFSKNFSNYLPSSKNVFDFLLIFRTRKQHLFGIISKGIGKGSIALAINISNFKIYSGNLGTSSTTYQSNFLVFGQGEIRLKNNWSPEVIVNSRIFGERYFNFKKEELVGKGEEGDSVSLECIEIHRLN